VHILLIYGERRIERALLLSSEADRMRVMMRGLSDVVEFRLVEGKWMSESGAAVEIGAVMPVGRPAAVEEELARSAQLARFFATDRFGHARAN